MNYISIDTIIKAYESLTSAIMVEPNVFHLYLICRAVGINKLEYKSTEIIPGNNGLYYASRISSLFTPEEAQPKKFGFINPFSMKKWSSSAVSEPLQKWVQGRIKNNIVGGATIWRKIIDIDTKTSFVKFKYNYIQEINEITSSSEKINLLSLAIWSNRFTSFEQKVTAKEVCEEFIKSYKLDNEEVEMFFNTEVISEIEYGTSMYDAQRIRDLIGQPSEQAAWLSASLKKENQHFFVLDSYKFNSQPTKNQDVTISLLKDILNEYSQLILSGPPGTSKSYYASELATQYDHTVHIQFHPQYSYQSFVGGYIVEKSDVVYKKGVLLALLDKDTFSPEKKYLLIIDELNRANVSQVLGETIQCLDRNQSVELLIDSNLQKLNIPLNVHIVATLNTTDRTLGSIDYAIKRRFMNVYCPPNPNLLIDLCPSNNFISLCDFLTKLNKQLSNTLMNKEMVVGHAVFLNKSVKDEDSGKYCWTFDSFRTLYNYKLLPMIEDYCSGNSEIVEEIVGIKLVNQLDLDSFKNAIKEFMEI